MWGLKGEYSADIAYRNIGQHKTETKKLSDEYAWKINADVRTWTLRSGTHYPSLFNEERLINL